MKTVDYPDHDKRYAHIPKSKRSLYPDEIHIGSTIFKRTKLYEDITSEDIRRYGEVNAYLLSKDTPYTDHGAWTHARRLELEEERRVMQRRESEIRRELKNLEEYCFHLNVETVDYWEGGSCRIREHCKDCNAVDYRGVLSTKSVG